MSVKIAAVQDRPVFLDRAGTIERVRELTRKAADEGAGLVVFPEAFVPGYPDWVWRNARRVPERCDRRSAMWQDVKRTSVRPENGMRSGGLPELRGLRWLRPIKSRR